MQLANLRIISFNLLSSGKFIFFIFCLNIKKEDTSTKIMKYQK